MRKFYPVFLLLCLVGLLCTRARAQRPIEVADMQAWNEIEGEQLNATGTHLLYTLSPDLGDPTAVVYDIERATERRFPRLHDARFSYDGRHLLGTLKPGRDTVLHLRRAERDKEIKDRDSLLVWDLRGDPRIHAGVYEVATSERAADIYAYTTATRLPDSLSKGLDKDVRRLVVRRFTRPDSFYVEGIKSFALARDRGRVVAHRVAKDSTWTDGVLYLNPEQLEWQALSSGPATYAGLAIDFSGERVGFLSHTGDGEDRQPAFQLHYWEGGRDSASVVSRTERPWMPRGFRISDDRTPVFSAEGNYLFFGTTPRRPELDSNALASELADVEVWTTEDPRMYTQQNVLLKDDRKFTYLAVYRTAREDFLQLADPEFPEASRPAEGRGHHVMVYNENPYLKVTTWAGGPAGRDAVVIDLKTGDRREILTGEPGRYEWSPRGEFVAWYNARDTAYRAYDLAAGQLRELTDNRTGIFYDERNDRPMDPFPYGTAGWLEDDGALLVYDRYDLWQLDPRGGEKPRRLTRGREALLRYRYRDLDPEREIDPDRPVLLTTFDETTYHGGFARLVPATGTVTQLAGGPYTYGNFARARSAERYVYTREDFREFPDLRVTDDLTTPGTVVTRANPQQADFSWGTAEGYTWTDLQGRQLRGLLIKPDNFDPSRKYPLLVNFYERSSEGLYRHRTPVPGRSSVNYSHYVSRGYVIFNPDVIYRVGYPGESAYDCVMSGVSSLIDAGFVDRERIGLQGHSWGGYQAAYLATKTDLFAAIESGAPVVNMFSAYGGIRWRSGRSRQFQYERTQSRIGGTPWEYPLRYLENSPIFTTDKISTPILILHNDHDGAVPWYQGIEWFTALRRLGKPAWLLNYRGEPHWPVKVPNRADFQIRMSQFFDHYLLGQPQPAWMREGVSPLERGIEQRLELSKE